MGRIHLIMQTLSRTLTCRIKIPFFSSFYGSQGAPASKSASMYRLPSTFLSMLVPGETAFFHPVTAAATGRRLRVSHYLILITPRPQQFRCKMPAPAAKQAGSLTAFLASPDSSSSSSPLLPAASFLCCPWFLHITLNPL